MSFHSIRNDAMPTFRMLVRNGRDGMARPGRASNRPEPT
ncbi:hypothetical protein NP88_5970 [Burkholderia cepacia]|nr:uncharacterized protein BCN122_I0987 [Burkholderia cenocepacia]EPZ87172.1 hypothetical protein BURCENK562V_C2049 [Burkholderia cenocepacia K56-2Valvano]ERI30657.1 hypothetical protein BURCENBC7_AP6167 [Burkholderia cenocepacia BC7]KIS46539.1 hypothetical protein NP88_5970 [Burkholderia cepacia]CDN59650.1 hypothetical protein I35_1127 [Burkholderia cenocepacia H111]